MEENIQTVRYPLVMVIDDTELDRYIAAFSLKKFHIAGRVISMESAGEALNYLRDHLQEPGQLPGLILLDIRMPVMDGFGFLEEYEKLPPLIHEHCRIIMLSSSLDPKDQERAAASRHVTSYISKPLTRKNADLI